MKAKDKRLNDSVLCSSTSPQRIAESGGMFFLKNENLSNKVLHDSAFATLPQHNIILSNSASKMRPLGKAECQKNCNSAALDRSNSNGTLECVLSRVIVAMEKLQAQGSALDTPDGALENSQSYETTLSMLQDAEKSTNLRSLLV